MDNYLITEPAGILAVLAAVASLFFFLEKKTGWHLFNFFPPLIFIYLLPVLLSNSGVIPNKSGVYDFMGANLLPMFLTIMLLDVNVKATVKVMGKGIFVMLLGTLGVVIGAPIALFLVKNGLGPEAWKGFGTASVFNKFTGISADRVKKMEAAAKEMTIEKGPLEMRHFLYLFFFGFCATALATWIAGLIPPWPPILSFNTYKILIVTVIGIGLSFTRASKIPGSHALAMALIYLFVARMGAKADLSNLSFSVIWFLLGAYIWIFIHGFFLVGAAKLFKVDVHTAAIASAANIGGAASAPVVAAYHNPNLVPVSILMALLGYAVGNPAAILAAMLCHWVQYAI
jgi:uncharacterized membrane protein